jgi:hypothetical protein
MPDPRTSMAPEAELAGSGARDPLSGLKVAIAWLVVGIPAAWGIYHVIVDALKLFRP